MLYVLLQDRMQRLKALQVLVLENAGKLQALPDMATVPPAPSEELMRSCLSKTHDNTVALADELQWRMCNTRKVNEAMLEALATPLHPLQVSSGLWRSRFA
jgi:hypothetical protein